MAISPFAGKPAPQELLADLTRLEQAYCEQRPDPDGVRERMDNALFRGLKRFPAVVEPAEAA